MLATFTSNQHETTFKTFTLILIYYETNKTFILLFLSPPLDYQDL